MTIATAEKKIDTLTVLVKQQTVLLNTIAELIRERQPVLVSAAPVVPAVVPVVVPPDFIATFPTLGPLRALTGDGVSDDGVWWVERMHPDRVTVVAGGRDGPTALRLHTEPGDSAVSGSGSHERADVALTRHALGFENVEHWGINGKEQWWSHSILFPDDYVPPPGGWSLVFNFHDDSNQGGQANFMLFANHDGLRFQGHAGPDVVNSANQYSYGGEVISALIRNVWFDFVYHVKWSWGTDGFFDAWLNGKKVLTHKGPTLYNNFGVYLKLANYHSALSQPSSVIHDRIIRGKTAASVALGPLE